MKQTAFKLIIKLSKQHKIMNLKNRELEFDS